MRLWSVHPRYLDRQGLVACWREGLLAQKVLTGQTRGYRNHPQLRRLRTEELPGAPVTTYLHAVVDEATARGYTFDRSKVLGAADETLRIEVADAQLAHEWGHLRAKLALRSPAVLERWADVLLPEPHPLFVMVPGPVAEWEVLSDRAEAAGTQGLRSAPPRRSVP